MVRPQKSSRPLNNPFNDVTDDTLSNSPPLQTPQTSQNGPNIGVHQLFPGDGIRREGPQREGYAQPCAYSDRGDTKQLLCNS